MPAALQPPPSPTRRPWFGRSAPILVLLLSAAAISSPTVLPAAEGINRAIKRCFFTILVPFSQANV